MSNAYHIVIKTKPCRFSWFRKANGFLWHATTRETMFALADQALVSITNFATGVIIGRFCIKEEFGLYMLAFSIVLFVTNVQMSFILTPYTVYFPRFKEEDKHSYAASCFLHQAGLSFFTIISLLIIGVVISLGFGPKGLENVMWTLAVVITFILLREYTRRISFANLQMMTAFWLDLFVAIVQICGLLLLSYTRNLTSSSAYLIIGLACGFPVLSQHFLIRKRYVLSLSRAVIDLKRNWSFAKWVFAGVLISMANYQLYPWILSGFHGIAATGELSACMGVILLANPFLLGLNNFLGPKMSHIFAKSGVEVLRSTVIKATIIFAVVMGIFCTFMIFCGGWVVVAFYGIRYDGNGMIVGLLSLGQLISSLEFPLHSGLSAMERPDIRFKSNLIVLALTPTMGLWLVKAFGNAGVAYSLLGGRVITTVLLCIAFNKLTNISFVNKN